MKNYITLNHSFDLNLPLYLLILKPNLVNASLLDNDIIIAPKNSFIINLFIIVIIQLSKDTLKIFLSEVAVHLTKSISKFIVVEESIMVNIKFLKLLLHILSVGRGELLYQKRHHGIFQKGLALILFQI